MFCVGKAKGMVWFFNSSDGLMFYNRYICPQKNQAKQLKKKKWKSNQMETRIQATDLLLKSRRNTPPISPHAGVDGGRKAEWMKEVGWIWVVPMA